VMALMNGGSFSTTCEFLSGLHSRKRATFIGEEAAGGYYGNTSGRMPTVILPNSKVAVRVPLQTYYLAVQGGDPRRSILPDVEVKPALQDLLAGSDPVMAKVGIGAGAENSGINATLEPQHRAVTFHQLPGQHRHISRGHHLLARAARHLPRFLGIVE
jgi:hypothetical protein